MVVGTIRKATQKEISRKVTKAKPPERRVIALDKGKASSKKRIAKLKEDQILAERHLKDAIANLKALNLAVEAEEQNRKELYRKQAIAKLVAGPGKSEPKELDLNSTKATAKA